MKQEIWLRIVVEGPVPNIAMQVQKGKCDLLAPAVSSDGSLVFEFPISVDLSDGRPNFLGPFAQGPKDVRFVYVSSGLQAGQLDTDCSRRAKIPLMSITADQVNEGIAAGKCLETALAGTGRDGLPRCATVKGIEWKVAAK